MTGEHGEKAIDAMIYDANKSLKNHTKIYNFQKHNMPNADKKILNQLTNMLPNAKIYYKAYIYGDIIDIVILEEGKEVVLIELSQIILSDYEYQDNMFVEKKTRKSILSPILKLKNFKDNLYKSHIIGLLEAKINSEKQQAYNMVKNIVIFLNESESNIIKFFNSDKVKYTSLLSSQNITKINNYKNIYITDKLYGNFQKAIEPCYHTKNMGIELHYTEKQKKLSKSEKGEYKVRGVAGSGKTYVLAKRAVNSHKRHLGNVLILTYNKSLKQYISSKINEIMDDFDCNSFLIDNYHNFIASVYNNLSIPKESNIIESDMTFQKYKSIFIDEVQDYETEWIRFIKDNFLEKNGEFVVFGDEKQNIYERTLDSTKKVNTTIKGRWNELQESHRFNDKIVDLANSFQDNFLLEKYEVVKINKQKSLNLANEHIEYFPFDKNFTLAELAYWIHFKIDNEKLNLKDISIVGSRIKFLQELDYIFRTELRRKTETVFERKESTEKFQDKSAMLSEIKNLKKEKFNIYANSIKLSTIHSFKGYEAETLFLILSAEDNTDEMIYTAFTRAKKNLYIINIGNQKYDKFFKENISHTNNIQHAITTEIEKTIESSNDASEEVKNLRDDLAKYELIIKEQKQSEAEKHNQVMELQTKLTKIEEEKEKSVIENKEKDKKLKEKSVLESKGKVIENSKIIEKLLIKCGAININEFAEKINYFNGTFPDSTIDKLHKIRIFRNNVTHEDKSYSDEAYSLYFKECENVIEFIKKRTTH